MTIQKKKKLKKKDIPFPFDIVIDYLYVNINE